MFFNGSEVVAKAEHKHLGVILGSKLSFQSHVREAIIKARKGVGIIRFLSKYVSRDVLDQIYKLYVRPHLDYGDIIYHRHDPEFKLEFTRRLESTQYSAAQAVSGAWRGTNTDKLYQELGWEFFITGGGIDVSVTFISFEIIRDLYTHTLRYHRNVLFIIICVELTYTKPMLKAPIGSLILISRTARESGTN